MKILLVDPPGKNKGFNSGLGYIAAILKKKHQVNVLDLNNIKVGLCGDANPDLSEEELRRRIYSSIDDFDPHIFGISVKTFTAHKAGSILGYAKERKKNIVTIVGGPHVTLDGVRYLDNTWIDFGIAGEGETALPLLCDKLKDNKDLLHLGGLLYRRDGKIVTNSITADYDELDELHFPDYTSFSSVKNNGGLLPQYPILTSRGCPFSCAYCSMPQIMGKKWRSHSPEYVINELKHAKENYSSNYFTVVDDNFTLDLKRVETISDQLINSQLELKWNSQNGIRADRITEKLARKMKHSGCYHVWIGIESADEKVFNAINKGEKLNSIRKGIRILKSAGIKVGGFFIVGLPHSTREADLKSVSFVKELQIDAWWFNFVPYPFTVAWDWVKKNARILRSPEGVLQYGTSDIEWVFETDSYSENERIKAYKEIHFKMGHFDRLFDSSLNQITNLKSILFDVCRIKPATLLSFILFIPKYNLSLILSKFKLYLKRRPSVPHHSSRE